MAIKQELEIEIAPDGTTKLKTHGIKGSECEAELKPLEAALGKSVSRERTPEYYEKAVTHSKTRTGTK